MPVRVRLGVPSQYAAIIQRIRVLAFEAKNVGSIPTCGTISGITMVDMV